MLVWPANLCVLNRIALAWWHVTHFGSLAPNVLPQTPQDVTVEVSTDSLVLGDKFTMQRPENVKQKDEHALGSFVDAPSLVLKTVGSSTAKTAVWFLGHSYRLKSITSDEPSHQGRVIFTKILMFALQKSLKPVSGHNGTSRERSN